MAAALHGARVVSIDDLRRLARARLPRAVFDYLDGGAGSEWTLRENVRVFDDVTFLPRGGVAHAQVDLSCTVAGQRFALPFLLAPIGSSRLMWPRAEVHAARAAGEAGTGYILSTLSGCTLESVREATRGPVWYQVYLVGGRSVAEAAIARAQAAGYRALVVTVDTPVAGHRERDVRNGIPALLSRRPLTMLPHLWPLLAHPRWLVDVLRDGGLMRFPNVVLPDGPMPYASVGEALAASTVTWEDLRWIRACWRGPVLVKGILTPDDARRAVDAGADGVIVSNHGGRQLDGVSSALRALGPVVAAAGAQCEVLMDGGIRRGSDIVKAIALGARAVLVGRAYAYGMSAAGHAGVTRAIDLLREDIERTLRLLGVGRVDDLTRTCVSVPQDWP